MALPLRLRHTPHNSHEKRTSPKVHEGHLNVSGLLYEGSDFVAWTERQDATLRVHNLQGFGSRTARGHGKHTSSAANVLARAKSAADLLLARTSPSITARIPEANRTNPFQIWRLLKELCKPFRFLDLPAELQKMIHQNIVKNHVPAHKGPCTIRDPLPPSTQVCKQLRKDGREAYYMLKELQIRVWRRRADSHTNPDWFKHTINSWLEICLGDNAVHLRSVSVGFYEKSLRKYTGKWLTELRGIVITFDPKNGVQIKPAPSTRKNKAVKARSKLTAESRTELESYADDINHERMQAGSQDGEAIILALLTSPRLWGLWGWDALDWEN